MLAEARVDFIDVNYKPVEQKGDELRCLTWVKKMSEKQLWGK